MLINSIKRFRIKRIISDEPYILADVEYLDDIVADKKSIEFKAITREVLCKLKMLSDNNPLFTEEMKLTMLNVDEPGKIADFVTSILNIEKNEYQDDPRDPEREEEAPEGAPPAPQGDRGAVRPEADTGIRSTKRSTSSSGTSSSASS